MAPQPSVLTVFSWLYLVVANLCIHYSALAKPIAEPDLLKCHPLFAGSNVINCCVPKSSTIVDFKPPPASAAVRVRRAAHLVDAVYVRTYERAVRLMKAIPASHPWSLKRQASVHCAYCDGSYNQTDYPGLELQVHFSWLFFPFHRAYLYFHERILGKLIGDDSFALPFWNWDAPDGMTVPVMYADPNSALYDETRDPNTGPPNVTDFGFGEESRSNRTQTNRTQLVDENLKVMYGQMVAGPKTAELFMGSPYRAGDKPTPGIGALESTPHSQIHLWTGGHMSVFSTAGLDPMFYAHHANVDRMWELWKALPGGTRKSFNDADFLDTAFVFWDENLQLVRIKVRDIVDTRSLGYEYQDVPLPWLNATSKTSELERPAAFRIREFPMSLDETVSIEVSRPAAVRNQGSKEEEVLVVDGIELDKGAHAQFDVYVGAAAAEDSASKATVTGKLAGSFLHLPMGTWRQGGSGTMITALRLGITSVLEELGAARDGSVVVVMIPRTPNAYIKVEAVRIEVSLGIGLQ